jgi:uncharacterized protein
VTRHVPGADDPRFHLAFPVTDLAETRTACRAFPGCAERRRSPGWVDLDFFGNAFQFKTFADPGRPFAN